ncbi:MAG: hypothetical protein ICV75_04140 [Nitrospiraceae bacterium]|nr:hypothetical protein [Nitrospiraceae bacterium]
MGSEDNVLRELLGEISSLISAYPKELERRASIIQAGGKDPELVEKLVKAADTMRDSGNLYLTWAKHYAAVAEGNSDASSDEDETEDFDV